MLRIFGPPGTGKTTTLLNMVDDALASGVHPHRIAFLAFTKKAATEAKERAAQRFNLDPKKDLMFFPYTALIGAYNDGHTPRASYAAGELPRTQQSHWYYAERGQVCKL
jgi:superfamily I DNA/RNA helicase